MYSKFKVNRTLNLFKPIQTSDSLLINQNHHQSYNFPKSNNTNVHLFSNRTAIPQISPPTRTKKQQHASRNKGTMDLLNRFAASALRCTFLLDSDSGPKTVDQLKMQPPPGVKDRRLSRGTSARDCAQRRDAETKGPAVAGRFIFKRRRAVGERGGGGSPEYCFLPAST